MSISKYLCFGVLTGKFLGCNMPSMEENKTSDFFEDNRLLTYKQVAYILGCSVQTVSNYTKREENPLKFFYLYPETKKEPRVKAQDLKEFMESLEDPRKDI